jgi:iron complex transport system substrate-binding protein
MQDARSRECWRAVALALLAGAGLLTGCGRDVSDKAPASAPAAAQSSQAASKEAARDYVVSPDVLPREKEAGPRRIISVAPCLTELCFALGLGDRLVGRTQYCLYPPAAQKVEVIGALLDPNLERILALQPDLVLITHSSGMLRERFEALRLPVLILPDSSLEDVYAAARQLGGATGRAKTADELVRHLQSDLARLKDQARAVSEEDSHKVTQKALFVTGALSDPVRSIWVAGPGGYLDSLLRMAGGKNVLEAGARPWQEISPEQILWLKPDVIVEVREVSSQMSLRDEAVAAWRRLPGLGKVRVVTLADPAVLLPGPRVNVMLEKMIEALHAN